MGSRLPVVMHIQEHRACLPGAVPVCDIGRESQTLPRLQRDPFIIAQNVEGAIKDKNLFGHSGSMGRRFVALVRGQGDVKGLGPQNRIKGKDDFDLDTARKSHRSKHTRI